jgi:hypothetical protein
LCFRFSFCALSPHQEKGSFGKTSVCIVLTQWGEGHSSLICEQQSNQKSVVVKKKVTKIGKRKENPTRERGDASFSSKIVIYFYCFQDLQYEQKLRI